MRKDIILAGAFVTANRDSGITNNNTVYTRQTGKLTRRY